MKNLSFVVLTLVVLLACQQSNPGNYEILLDKIWYSEPNGVQYYLSSKDQCEYMWTALEVYDGKTNWLEKPAKGTPATHLFDKDFSTINFSADYREGWSLKSYFKVVGDSLLLQDVDDLTGQTLSKYHLSRGEDITVGVHDYHVMYVKNQFGRSKWRTKK